MSTLASPGMRDTVAAFTLVTAAEAEPTVGLGRGALFKPFWDVATSESAANPTAAGL